MELLSVVLKIATTLINLVTGQTYTSLHPVQSWEGHITKVCHPNLQDLHLTCPTTREGWKEIETEFWLRCNVPHAIGALDGNHVAIRKPPKSGRLYELQGVLLCSPDGRG